MKEDSEVEREEEGEGEEDSGGSCVESESSSRLSSLPVALPVWRSSS